LFLEARIRGGAISDAGDDSESDGPADDRKMAGKLKSDYASGGDGVNRDVGPCAAMGSFCSNKNLERNRHACNGCGKCMHIIGACLGKQDPETDSLLCGMCFYEDDIDRATLKKVSQSRLQDTEKDDSDCSEAEFEGPFCKVIHDTAFAFGAPCAIVKKAPQNLLPVADKDSGEAKDSDCEVLPAAPSVAHAPAAANKVPKGMLLESDKEDSDC
jgi:hypothetical protein